MLCIHPINCTKMNAKESSKSIISFIKNINDDVGWCHSFNVPGRKCYEDPDRGRHLTASAKATLNQPNNNDIMLRSIGHNVTKNKPIQHNIASISITQCAT